MSQLEQPHLSPSPCRTRHYSDDDFDMDIEDGDFTSETESVSSAAIFSTLGRTVATTVTSIDDDGVSMRTPSPEPDPIMHMDEPLRDNLYKEEFGRNLNNYSDVYKLPADEEELDRLERQYDMLNSLLGRKYVPPMFEVLADDGLEKAVVDLGSGSGNWIIDVARDFPHCSAVAIDLAPMRVMYDMIGARSDYIEASVRMPTNLRSEVDDINLGLEHLYGNFDVVHTRLIAIGVKDYFRLIDEISDVLRPGGLIDLTEVGYLAYDKHHRPIEIDIIPNPKDKNWKAPYWAHWLKAVAIISSTGGGEISASRSLKDWLHVHRAYEDVVHDEFWLPIIPGDYDRPPIEAEFLKNYRNALEYDVMTFLRAGRPMLLKHGYDEAYLSEIERLILGEMREAKEPQYSRIECVYARKVQELPALSFDKLS